MKAKSFYLTHQETARMLGFSMQQIVRFIEEGTLESYFVGGNHYFKRPVVEQIITHYPTHTI